MTSQSNVEGSAQKLEMINSALKFLGGESTIFQWTKALDDPHVGSALNYIISQVFIQPPFTLSQGGLKFLKKGFYHQAVGIKHSALSVEFVRFNGEYANMYPFLIGAYNSDDFDKSLSGTYARQFWQIVFGRSVSVVNLPVFDCFSDEYTFNYCADKVSRKPHPISEITPWWESDSRCFLVMVTLKIKSSATTSGLERMFNFTIIKPPKQEGEDDTE